VLPIAESVCAQLLGKPLQGKEKLAVKAPGGQLYDLTFTRDEQARNCSVVSGQQLKA